MTVGAVILTAALGFMLLLARDARRRRPAEPVCEPVRVRQHVPSLAGELDELDGGRTVRTAGRRRKAWQQGQGT